MPTLPDVASSTLLLSLQADALSLSDGAAVSTWPDLSGQGHTFTQTGVARPTKQTISGYPAVVFDGVDDWMDGGNFADNLSSFTVFVVYRQDSESASTYHPLITKADNILTAAGWAISNEGFNMQAQEAGGSVFSGRIAGGFVGLADFHVRTYEFVSKNNVHFYVDSASDDDATFGTGGVANMSTTTTVRLAALGDLSLLFQEMSLRAAMIYSPAPSATDRTAIEAWLRGKYGLPIPILQTSATAYWTLNEASATRYDATGNGNPLTEVHGAVGSATGTNGVGAQFTAASGRYLQAASTTNLQIASTRPYTITAWVKLQANHHQSLVVKGTAGVYEYQLYWNGSNAFGFTYNDATVAVPITYSASSFFFLEAFFDPSLNSIRLRVNNSDTASTTVTPASGGAGALGVGGDTANDPSNPDVADAIIDEVGIWRRLLTASERAQLYAGAVWPFTSSLEFFRATTSTSDVTGSIAYDVASYVVTSCTLDNTGGAVVLTAELYKIEGADLILWQTVVAQPGASVTKAITPGLIVGLDGGGSPDLSFGNLIIAVQQ